MRRGRGQSWWLPAWTAWWLVWGAVACGGSSPGTNQSSNDNGNSNSNSNDNSNQSNANECRWEDICHVDFPCEVISACTLDATRDILDNETRGCEEVCGPCCDGAWCLIGSSSCSDGEVCAYPDSDPRYFRLATRFDFGFDVPSCVPLTAVCGGLEALPCSAGEYCELVGALCSLDTDWSEACIGDQGNWETDFCAYGEAGGYGTCRVLPDPSTCMEADPDPVCSCDGTTYDNDCLRRAAGAAYRAAGPCEE